MRSLQFGTSEFYHVYSRGVDQRPIFMDDSDKLRFINSVYLLNNFREIPNRLNVYNLEPKNLLVPIKPYTDIVAGCLMDNHYHLMLSPNQEDGLSKLLHKLGTSYTKYFNTKYERSGRLFESTFRAKHVDRHEYATYLTQYIHLNPVSLYQAKLGTTVPIRYIEEYQWSSLPDYLGRKSKFSTVISHSFRSQILELDPDEYRPLLQSLYKELYQA